MCKHVRHTMTVFFLGKKNEDRTRCNGIRTLRFGLLRRRRNAGKGCQFSTLQEVQRTFKVGSCRASTGESSLTTRQFSRLAGPSTRTNYRTCS